MWRKELGARGLLRNDEDGVFGNEGIGGDPIACGVVRADEGRGLLYGVHRRVDHHRAATVVGGQVDDAVRWGFFGVVVVVVLNLERVNVVRAASPEIQVGMVWQALGVVVVEQRPQRGQEHRSGRGRGEKRAQQRS